MLRFLKGFFAKPKNPDTLAPYKVEAPAEAEVAPALAPIVQEKPVKRHRQRRHLLQSQQWRPKRPEHGKLLQNKSALKGAFLLNIQ